MPTFCVTSKFDEEACFWVYAIDDWDARDQIERALGLNAQDESDFNCAEDGRLSVPLNVIVHASGAETPIPPPGHGSLITPDLWTRRRGPQSGASDSGR